MSPVIERLKSMFPKLPRDGSDGKHWTFSKRIDALGPAFYKKIVPQTAVIQLELSLANAQLRRYLLAPENVTQKQFKEQLESTLMMCELSEHIHKHYLIVPREVARLQQQKKLLQSLLIDLEGYTFDVPEIPEINAEAAWSQKVRDTTIQSNWYRILLNRSRRFLSLLDALNISDGFHDVVEGMNKNTNAIFAHLNWFFHVPRLLTNSFLLVKHTAKGSWMDDKEQSLDWKNRLSIQFGRRWFELSNDVTWVTIGALSCFLLVGGLAPIAIFLNVVGFAIDVLNVVIRAYVELNRLSKLTNQYQVLLARETDPARRQSIEATLQHIKERTAFEEKRFAIQIINNTLVLAAMVLAIPFLALNPVGIFVTAAFLLTLWVAAFVATRMVEKLRPPENIEKPVAVSSLSFFGKIKEAQNKEQEPTPEPSNPFTPTPTGN